MLIQTACEALRSKRCLVLRYDGFTRLVEVHSVGTTREHHAVARVWQVSGGSVSHEPVGWKMLRLDEATGGHLSEQPSHAPRPGYRRNDKQIMSIRCQV